MSALQYVLVIMVIFKVSKVLSLPGNNACKTYQDYTTLNSNKNCWYDPDFALDTPQLIEKYVGRAERHKVVTEDGYILTVFRMPRANPKGAVLMMHGLAMDGRMFLTQGNQSTALAIWRAGYDVWLGNQRGTKVSLDHVNMTSADYKYWDFSFHEVGLYDIPAMIKLVRSKTGSGKIIYYGFSMGTTNGFVYASMRPDDAQRSVKVFIMPGPAVQFRYVSSLIRILAGFTPALTNLTKALRLGPAIPSISLVILLSRISARITPFTMPLLHAALMLALGWTPDEADSGIDNADFSVNLSNVSWRLLLHYGQIVRSGGLFRMFDYGPDQNRKSYGSDSPPLYPLQNITVPMYMISSKKDTCTTVKDSEDVFNSLSENAKIYGKLVIDYLNHVDHVYGKHRQQELDANVVRFLERFELSSRNVP